MLLKSHSNLGIPILLDDPSSLIILHAYVRLEMLWWPIVNLKENLLLLKSAAYSSQGSHTGQLNFCN